MAKKIIGKAFKVTKTAMAEESPSLAAVMQDAFFTNMERVMLDMQKGMAQLAKLMKRAQRGQGRRT